jgi:hypothetical protein
MEGELLSPSLEPTVSELENAGMISHPAKGSSFEAKYPAQFEIWQNVWTERQTTASRFWQYELIKLMNFVDDKEMSEHLPNDTSPMLRETTELKDVAKIRELPGRKSC